MYMVYLKEIIDARIAEKILNDLLFTFWHSNTKKEFNYRIIVHTNGRVEHNIYYDILDKFREDCINLFNSHDIIETYDENKKCIVLTAMNAKSKKNIFSCSYKGTTTFKKYASLIVTSFLSIFKMKSKYYGKIYPENDASHLKFLFYLKEQL
ncbi:hypothetical protein RFI_07591, partial [Reticulomyxa filosa]